MTRPIELPDCTDRETGPVLSARQRRELVRVLAEDGLEGMEAWIEEEAARDPRIRERVERERARLERQARRKKRELEAEREEERQAHEERYERELEDAHQREQALRERLDALDRDAPRADELAETSELFRELYTPDDEERQPSLWERFKGWLYKLWIRIVDAWARFVAWLRGERADDGPTIDLAGDVDLDLHEALATNPGVRVRVREKMAERGLRERLRSWWRRLTGREDYETLARELMAEELESAEDTIEAQRAQQKAQLEERLESVEEDAADTRRERRESLEELERSYDERLEALEETVERGPLADVRELLLDELGESGLVGDQGRPTRRLLERFSTLLYEDVTRALPRGGRVQAGAFLGGEGEYEKHPLRSLNERGNVALVDSVVRSKQNHPTVNHLYDSDLLVHREVRSNTTHVVLVFDRSGSMEEKGRFEAAKKVCLVMHEAVHQADPRHRVDVLSMATDVERVDLEGTWNAELGGFTNHGEALRQAYDLLEHEDADRRLVYLITDGLPEAYTDEDGEIVVDEPDVCMEYAREQATRFRDMAGARVMILQLEDEDELYVDAAREIADAAGGAVEALDPQQLAETVVLDFEAAMGEPRG